MLAECPAHAERETKYVPGAVDSDACEVLARATAYCRSKGISHTTIQLLHGQEACCIVSPRGHAL